LERNADDAARHTFNFYSGRIVHGLQFADPARRNEPTVYYGRDTGAGQAMAGLAQKEDLRVGLIGLGIGTMAAYAKPGQSFRFYELNSEVLRFAEDYFTYLRDCQGRYTVVLGDGRLSLESEEPRHFDLLVLDAFSGDAVPTHLLTKEAFEIYRRHLQPQATVAINISNRYLDLAQVVAGLAEHFGFTMRRVTTQGDAALGQFPADWILLSPPGAKGDVPLAADGQSASLPQRTLLWTDDHSNLFEILK
jgi:hypothetical protein